MTDHKYTDEEVIRAVECCFTPGLSCKACPTDDSEDLCHKSKLLLLEIVNRQKKEIKLLLGHDNFEHFKNEYIDLKEENERLRRAIQRGKICQGQRYCNDPNALCTEIANLEVCLDIKTRECQHAEVSAIKKFAKALKRALARDPEVSDIEFLKFDKTLYSLEQDIIYDAQVKNCPIPPSEANDVT